MVIKVLYINYNVIHLILIYFYQQVKTGIVIYGIVEKRNIYYNLIILIVKMIFLISIGILSVLLHLLVHVKMVIFNSGILIKKDLNQFLLFMMTMKCLKIVLILINMIQFLWQVIWKVKIIYIDTMDMKLIILIFNNKKIYYIKH